MQPRKKECKVDIRKRSYKYKFWPLISCKNGDYSSYLYFILFYHVYLLCVYERRPPKLNYLLKGGPLVVQASPTLGGCSRNPSVSVYQLVLLWEAALALVKFFEDTFSVFAHFMMGDYEPACPHHAECSAVFNQRRSDSHAPPSLFTWSCRERHFLLLLFPQMKNVLEGKCPAYVEEVEQEKWQKH